MIRRAVTVAVATVVTFLAVALSTGLSWADTVTPYPAPPVTGHVVTTAVPTTGQVVTSVVQTTGSSSAIVPIAVNPVQPATDLASTGAGLNVGLTVGIGVAIILLGIVLVVFGARRSGRKHA